MLFKLLVFPTAFLLACCAFPRKVFVDFDFTLTVPSCLFDDWKIGVRLFKAALPTFPCFGAQFSSFTISTIGAGSTDDCCCA